MNQRGEYGAWQTLVGNQPLAPFDPGSALQQVDGAMEGVIDALYRAMGADPTVLRRPAVVDDAWMQRVRDAKRKAQQSSLWPYWETSIEPKYNDWRSARQLFATKPMLPEDFDRWLTRVTQLRADMKTRGIKLEAPATPALNTSQPEAAATDNTVKWIAIGTLAIGSLLAIAALEH